jgi:NitT/TauT family transport system permease protein
MSRSGNLFGTLVFIAVLVTVWAGLAAILGERLLPGPIGTMERVVELARDADFGKHVLATGQAFAIAFALVCVAGVALGVAMGTSGMVRETVEPAVFGLLSVPKVALYPVILLLFGLGTPAKVCFGFLHGLPVLALVVAGVLKNIRPVYLRVARSLNLSRGATGMSVMLPYAVPEIISGLQLAFSITLQGVIIGELFASKEGLGFMLMQAIGSGDVRTALALTLLMVIGVTGVNAVMRHFHGRARVASAAAH